MNGSVVSSVTNTLPSPPQDIRSPRGKVILTWGVLESIIQLDDDFIGLAIGGKIVEAPVRLESAMKPYVKQTITIFCESDNWRWERCGA
jgi:hypothetical protein